MGISDWSTLWLGLTLLRHGQNFQPIHSSIFRQNLTTYISMYLAKFFRIFLQFSTDFPFYPISHTSWIFCWTYLCLWLPGPEVYGWERSPCLGVAQRLGSWMGGQGLPEAGGEWQGQTERSWTQVFLSSHCWESSVRFLSLRLGVMAEGSLLTDHCDWK